MTKIAIVGAGGFSARHLPALVQLGGPMWVDLADPVPAAWGTTVALLAGAGGVKGEA